MAKAPVEQQLLVEPGRQRRTAYDCTPYGRHLMH
jgi:hypothetical protein